MRTPKWFLKKSPVALILWPISLLYFLGSKTVYVLRFWGQKKSKRPIICVGNILSGGVGKTPIVIEIAQRLDAPVVMRGYKKSAETGDVGDEAKMMSQLGLQVHVGDRKSNVAVLNKQDTHVPIVMDDGFQNPKIKKDISILVFDDWVGFGNGFMLPAGPLREPKSAIKRADAVLVIRGAKHNPKFQIPYDVPVFYANNKNSNPYKNEKVIAFAGIGYPQKFFNAIDSVKTVRFPDHYQYTEKDIQKLLKMADKKQAKLLTTEKDWVRLPAYAQKQIKFSKLETVIEPAFWDWLEGKLKCAH